MLYLFIGMLIGGILGLAIGSLGTAVKFLREENCRIRREVNN